MLVDFWIQNCPPAFIIQNDNGFDDLLCDEDVYFQLRKTFLRDASGALVRPPVYRKIVIPVTTKLSAVFHATITEAGIWDPYFLPPEEEIEK